MDPGSYNRSMFFTISMTYCKEGDIEGVLYCPQVKGFIQFEGLIKLILIMDKIMEDCNVPKYDGRFRRLNTGQEINKIEIDYVDSKEDMKDYLNFPKKELKKYNHVFHVEMMRRQNYSWQGKMMLIKGNKVRFFRSSLEFIKLVLSI